MSINSEKLIKAGAVAYVMWGVLHVWVGLYRLASYWTNGAVNMLQGYGTGLEASSIGDPGNLAASVVAQHSANLAVFGALGIIVAVTLIWRQQKLGFWLNLIILAIADAAFVFALLMPGYMHIKDGLLGPVLFLVAAILTGVGFYAPKPAVQSLQEPIPAV